jgi:uncharacterized membrane protein YdbT with pleckstrin-like domain
MGDKTMSSHYLDSLLSDREKIILVDHQHWFVLFAAIFVEIVSIFIIIAIITVLIVIKPDIRALVSLGYLLTLIPIASLTRDVLAWTNREYIITSRRVMQIAGIIYKNVTDSSLEKVNDVKLVQSVWGRMFGFGDIEILTGSELGANLFRRIANPVKFKIAMMNAKERLERGSESGAVSNDIPTLINGLDQLRKQGVLSEEEFQAKKKELLAKI